MKNHFFLAGMLLVVLAGCTKEKEPPAPGPSDGDGSISITAKLVETKPVLGPSSGTSRPVLWQPEDQLWVRSAAQVAGTSGHQFTTSADKISPDSKEAVFTG